MEFATSYCNYTYLYGISSVGIVIFMASSKLFYHFPHTLILRLLLPESARISILSFRAKVMFKLYLVFILIGWWHWLIFCFSSVADKNANSSHAIRNSSHAKRNSSHVKRNSSHVICNSLHGICNSSHGIRNSSHGIRNSSHDIRNSSHP